MKSSALIVLLSAIIVIACIAPGSNSFETHQGATKAAPEPDETPAAYFVFNYHITNREAYDSYLAEVPKLLESYQAKAPSVRVVAVSR